MSHSHEFFFENKNFKIQIQQIHTHTLVDYKFELVNEKIDKFFFRSKTNSNVNTAPDGTDLLTDTAPTTMPTGQYRLAIVHSKRKSLKFTVADLHCSEMP